MQVWLGADALFINHRAAPEPVEAIFGGIFMRRALGEQMRIAITRGRRGLEAAVTPARVDEQTVNIGAVDEGRAVHRHIHDAAPHAQQARAPDHRHDRHAAFADVFDHRQIAALGVGVVAVDVAAKDQDAFVRLADLEVARAKSDHAGEGRF